MSPTPAPPAPATLEQLARDLRSLAERVERLESRFEARPATAVSEPTPKPIVVDKAAELSLSSSGMAGLAGKALLGLAGAYLLRALTEMKAIPLSAGVGLGIVYALGWLSLASRAPASERMAVAVRAITSTLILIPLLWEAQIRFGALSTAITAAVLALFSIFGLAVSWRKDLAPVAWVATLTGAFTIFAMMIATHDLVPFTAALLALAVAVEISACLEHWLKERWIIAGTADLAVVLTVYLVTQSGGLPEGYAPVGRTTVVVSLLALLAIYLASMTVRTLGRGFVVLPFEIVQCVLAFVIAGVGVTRVARGDSAVLLALGAFCGICAAGCYAVSFVFHTRACERERNLRTYAIFGFVLTVAACWLLFSGTVLAAGWAALGVAFAVLGVTHRSTLAWHGGAYLVLAVLSSGLGSAVIQDLAQAAGKSTGGSLHAQGLLVLAACATCTFILQRYGRFNLPTLTAIVTGAAILGSIAVVTDILARYCHHLPSTNAAHWCPTASTGLLSASVIGLAWAARRNGVRQLLWVAYTLLAIASAKLLMQDLPSGHMLAIVASLVVYGGTLIQLPRMSRA